MGQLLAHPLTQAALGIIMEKYLSLKVQPVYKRQVDPLSQNKVHTPTERVGLPKWISTKLILGLIASIPCPSDLFG